MIVTLRPTTENDEPFLRRLIVESIGLELGSNQWPEPLRGNILEMQYTGRRNAWRSTHPEAQSSLILVDGTEAGWVVVATEADSIYLAEIIVHPELRGRGIAKAVLEGILDTGRVVHLEVLLANTAAIRLYEGMGFRRVRGDEVRQWMEYQPG